MKKLLIAVMIATSFTTAAQNYKQQILDTLIHFAKPYNIEGDYKIIKAYAKGDKYIVMLGEPFESLPYRKELADSMELSVKSIIKERYGNCDIELQAGGENIRRLIPNYYLNKGERDLTKFNNKYTKTTPFITKEDRAFQITKGLQDRNLAIWQSHGLYYNQRADRWIWQRARVFTTVEDKFTLSFVVPYLLPMLDRAGANVLLPRERDYQKHEVVVDNDYSSYTSGHYRERGKFTTDDKCGFGYKRDIYTDMQNPFREGTFRKCRAAREESATARWIPDIPEDGWYWVSISYATTKKSIPDAKYTVNHSAGSTTFKVNQRMGGGTWIYLGKFYFEKGEDADRACVILSNESGYNGDITADAVRFGGGMGNIARRPMTQAAADSIIEDEKIRKKVADYYEKEKYSLSGVAKFWEGAKYWLQWAGAPEEVISFSKGVNDYVDEYTCRPLWVNWLNHGSVNAPDSIGLGIPIDLAMAWHSDAGCRIDTTIGTLGIYTTLADPDTKERVFPHGQSRYVSRDLTDMITTQVIGDIRKTINPKWTRRWMWDKNYSESRRPEVPTMLLELLSHQNFEDMQYGLDPRFKFIAARAIYKAMAKFITFQNGEECVIAPLPIHNFSIEFEGQDCVRLKWMPTIDTLESSAVSKGYVVYSRRNGEGWDNGVYTTENTIQMPIEEFVTMSYKVVAVNEGGASMDSEILSACKTDDDRTVMIINGFDRVSGPEGFEAMPYAGFPDWLDRGVGDIVELQYVGKQHDFDTRKPWISDDDSGWGESNSDCQYMTIAGNTHDYPYIHGRAIVAAGYSFVSCSRGAVENEMVNLNKYSATDLILGEQKETMWANDSNSCVFRTFSLNLQNKLREYTSNGGSLMVSGAYVATDNWKSVTSTEEDRNFVRDVLKVEWRADRASQTGDVEFVYSPELTFDGKYKFEQTLNDKIYAVESPDALSPIGEHAYTVMRYTQNSSSAAVAYKGCDYRSWVSGFPFETIKSEEMRESLMQQILHFLIR